MLINNKEVPKGTTTEEMLKLVIQEQHSAFATVDLGKGQPGEWESKIKNTTPRGRGSPER